MKAEFFLPTTTARSSILLAILAACIFAKSDGTPGDGVGSLRWNGTTYALINGTVIIPCGVLPLARRSASREPTIAWFKNDQALENTGRRVSAGGNLTISKFEEEDVGRYHCTAAIEKGTIRGDDFPLVLPGIGAIEFTESSVTLAPGDFLRLVCPVQSWAPAPTSVQWYRGSEAVQLSDRTVGLPGGVLIVKNMSSDDAGEYRCSATAWGGEQVDSSSSIHVSLNESVLTSRKENQLVQSPPQDVVVTPGGELVLECLVQPGNGVHTVWQKLTAEPSGLVVKFVDVTPSDDVIMIAGMYIRWPSYSAPHALYRCLVLNGAGDELSSFQTTINVATPPRAVRDDIEEKVVKDSRTARFGCNVLGARDRVWYKDGVEVELCIEKQVLGDGTLEVSKVASYDTGIYQCVVSAAYGTASLTYHLNVPNGGGPSMPVITSADFIDNDYVAIKWRQALNGVIVFAYTFRFVEEKCSSHLKPISKVVPVTYTIDGKPAINCRELPSTNETLCSYDFEVLDNQRNYFVYVASVTTNGTRSSRPKLARAVGRPTGTETPLQPMNLRVLDFDAAMLVQWDGVANVAGYHLDVRRQAEGTGSVIQVDAPMDRSNDQTYAMIKAPTTNTSMSLTVTAVQDPITHRQTLDVTVVRPRFADRVQAPTDIFIKSHDSDDGSKGVLIVWKPQANVSYFYVWYKCDGKETLRVNSARETVIVVKAVEIRCTVVVAPVLRDGLTNDTTGPAQIQTYERWCKTLPTPEITSISPAEGLNSTLRYPMLVEWTAHNGSCEVNYQLRWKMATADLYLERDSLVVHELFSAVVNGLKKDVTYDFQLMVFTNASDLTTLSNVSSYTIGPPHTAKDVQVDLQGFPQSPVELTWSAGQSGHSVNFYLVKLFKRGIDSQWMPLNLSTVPVTAGVQLRIDYKNLSADTEYKVAINSINHRGSSGVTTFLFRIPAPPVPTAPPTREAAFTSTTGSPVGPKVALTEIETGVVIGFCTSFVFVFFTALICILTRRRWKREDRRHCRSRSSRFESSASTYSCQQPLTIDMSHYEITSSVAGDLSESSLANNNDFRQPLRTFVSPQQLSQKDNSGQDSGISGTADDHRSSQDLEEYDDGAGLLNSTSSLNSRASTSGPVSCPRWSGDHSNYTGPSLVARLRNESESDSLLAESKRPTSASSISYGKHSSKAVNIGHCTDITAECSSLGGDDHHPLTMNEAVV